MLPTTRTLRLKHGSLLDVAIIMILVTVVDMIIVTAVCFDFLPIMNTIVTRIVIIVIVLTSTNNIISGRFEVKDIIIAMHSVLRTILRDPGAGDLVGSYE